MENNDGDMLECYIKAVSKNVNIERCQKIDLVIGGGAFNGTYGYGNCMFLKELEKNGKIEVNRISGCSVGSLLALAYLTDNFILAKKGYFDKIRSCLKTNGNMSVLKETVIRDFIDNIFETDEKMRNIVNGKLYISYSDISECKQVVISEFSDKNHLIDTILRSSFIPLLVDGNIKTEEKFVDGIFPYIFKDSINRILYIELVRLNVQDLIKCMVTKKEKNIHYRIIQGVADASRFFTEGYADHLSWYDNWSFLKVLQMNAIYFVILSVLMCFDFISSFSLPESVIEMKLTKFIANVFDKLGKEVLYSIHD